MIHEFEQKIAQLIKSDNLLSPYAKVIVGLSGGADSVALLAALQSLGYQCVGAHCNFSLRDNEADRDQQHAENIASMLGAKWQNIRFDTKTYMQTHGVSAEMACRELRYHWFNQLLETTGAEAIAVAHHRDDNVETLLLNLLRGSGIHGLRGMKPRNGNVIRPMLNCSRAEVIDYLTAKGLSYITDSSNLVNDVKRNKLRNIILPMLNAQFPGASEAIARSINILRQNELIINETADNAFRQYMTDGVIHLDRLYSKHPDSAQAILFELLYPMGFNATQIRDIAEAYSAGNTGRQFLTVTCSALIDRGQLIISPLETTRTTDNEEYSVVLGCDITEPITLKMERIPRNEFHPQRDANVIYLDAKALDPNCHWILRHWQKGDRMTPFGMTGSKKLSDIFSDAHISLKDKNQIWLLTCNKKIVWITGIRTSNLFRITDRTTDILKITYIPK